MTAHFLRSYSAAADQDLPPPRHPRHGRHGGADPDQERSGGQRDGAGQGARGQAARGRRRPRRHLGGASRPGADRQGDLRRAHDRRRTRSPRKREDVHVTAADLLRRARRARSPKPACGRTSTSACRYLEAWLRGNGCVPIYNLMEDAATAEISRAQVWQWVRHGATLQDGRPVTKEFVREIVREENDKVKAAMGEEALRPGSLRGRRPAHDRAGRAAGVRGVPDPAGL